LFIPDQKEFEKQTIGALFTPDYWHYAMFKSISENAKKEVSPGTLSILTNPKHPLFNSFPTSEYSDWQWWPIIHHSRPMILNETRGDYKPIVQVIDNIERNHKLGLVFEFLVGKGKLLVCMSNLDEVSRYVEGKAFRISLLRYMKSSSFKPTEQLTWDKLVKLFNANVTVKDIQGVENQSDYTLTNPKNNNK